MSAESVDVTRLLHRLTCQDDAGRKETYDRLISPLDDDLRHRARHQMRNEWDKHTLQPTALVHEAYERLIQFDMRYENREHFLNVAAAAMRRLLIDYARNKKSSKRGADQERTLFDDGMTAVVTRLQSPEELIDLNNALEKPAVRAGEIVRTTVFCRPDDEGDRRGHSHTGGNAEKALGVVKLLLNDRLKGHHHEPS